jgi:hypothetical protein
VQQHARWLVAAILLVLLVTPRLAHLVGPIDDPHSWRQCDTAQYAFGFHRDGIDILHPSVCWMGKYKTVILEFPFPELLMALAYNLFGCHLYLARLLTLAFFGGSAFYLFLIVRYLFHERLAAIATSVYLILPLSLFYSRAVHVDFFAVFFAHAMTYHLIRVCDKPSLHHLLIGSAAAALAFLIKAPYAFYFAPPLVILAVRKHKSASILLLALGLCIPAVLFLVWRAYVERVNAAAPDWVFIPGYRKLVNMGAWYYGPLEMRWDPEVWRRLLGRFRHAVLPTTGSWLFIVGAVYSLVELARRRARQDVFLWSWLLGLLAYLIIFLNLNYVHDYYQIPFLAIASIFVALAIELPMRYSLFAPRLRYLALFVSLGLYLLVATSSFARAEHDYFKVDWVRVEAAAIVRDNTAPDGLIIATSDDPHTDCRDPRFLYQANRSGWSINKQDLSPSLLGALRALGAKYLVVLAPESNHFHEVCGHRAAVYQLTHKPWKVIIAEL